MRARLAGGAAGLLVLLGLLGGCDSASNPPVLTTSPTTGSATLSSEVEYVHTVAPTTTTSLVGPCWIVPDIVGAEGELIYPDWGFRVDLMEADGDLLWSCPSEPECVFDGLQPGSYRLAVHAKETDRYMSQWYGGLPYNGHSASESQILEVGPGENVAEFVLQVGRTISGTVEWSGAELGKGTVRASPVHSRDDGRTAGFSADDHTFVIQGLCPGAYKLTFAGNYKLVCYGGDSWWDATIVDVSEGDVTGISVDLGVLPPPPSTVPVSVLSDPPSTISPTTTTTRPHGS